MAKIVIKNPAAPEFGGTPYGNHIVRPFLLQLGALGVPVGAMPATPIANGDQVFLGALRAGMCIHNAVLLISQALPAGVAAKFGFLYSDGVDDTVEKARFEGRQFVPQDDAFFFAAGEALSATKRKTTDTFKRTVTLPRDANLVMTITAGTPNAPGVLEFFVHGEDRGAL